MHTYAHARAKHATTRTRTRSVKRTQAQRVRSMHRFVFELTEVAERLRFLPIDERHERLRPRGQPCARPCVLTAYS